MGTSFRRQSIRVAVIFLAATLAGCGSHFGRGKQKSTVPAGEVGSRLPDFTANDLRGSGEFSSANLRGKVVIVDFWGTWCAPCKTEMPGYQKLLDKYETQGLAVVGFKATMMADTEDPVKFAQTAGVRYPLAVATPGIVDKFGGLKGLPTTFIYGRDGILRQKIIGFEYTDQVEAYLKPLLQAR